jgi:hypothetical protein
MANNRHDSSKARVVVAMALIAWIGVAAAIVLIIYAVATPEGGSWAFWAGLGALVFVGVATIVSRAVRLAGRG